MIKTEIKNQFRNLMRVNLSNNSGLLTVLLLVIAFFSCNNEKGETPEESKKEMVKTEYVDTLGQKLKKVVKEVYADSNPKKVLYFKDKNDYLKVQFWKSGRIYMSGWYKDGKREGNWKSWHKNGQLWSKGEYSEGKRQGKSTVFYENGYPRIEQEYKKGKPHGKWIFYDTTSKKMMQVKYDEGEKLSEKRF